MTHPAVLLDSNLTVVSPSVKVMLGDKAHAGDAVGHETTYTVTFSFTSYNTLSFHRDTFGLNVLLTRDNIEATGVPLTVLNGICC